MSTTPPRRIAQLAVTVEMPQSTREFSVSDKSELELIANTCPVRLSLVESMDVPVLFVWP